MMLTPPLISEFDSKAPENTETATFGFGCFWGPDAAVSAIDGVIRTRVGYAGGTKPDPSYEVIGDHTEVVQVEYDPDQLSFENLLEWAFSEHQPSYRPTKRQYQNIVFTETDKQYEQLQTFLDESGINQERLETRFEELDEFYVAKDYHQKFQLRGKRWITDVFDEANYDAEAIRESPAAAKLNAHAAGYGVDVSFLQQPYDRQSR